MGESAGQGWEGMRSEVRLAGWTKRRRIILLRRPLPEDLAVARRKGKGRRRKAQMELEMGWAPAGTVLYEYAVLVTSLDEEISRWPNTTGTGATRRTILTS
jgi:hypothetical protein